MHKRRIISPRQIVAVAVSSAVVLCAGGLLLSMMARAQKKDASLYLHEATRQTATTVIKELEGKFELLGGIATIIGERDEMDPTTLMPLLRVENDRNLFRRMAYITTTGLGYIVDTNGESYASANFASSDYLQAALSGQRSLMLSSHNTVGDLAQFDTYTVPIIRNGAVTGALAGAISPESLQTLISGSVLRGSGYTHIIRSNGELVVRSARPEAANDTQNFLERLNSASRYNLISRDLKNNRSGNVTFTEGQSKLHATYVPLGVNDWFLLSIVPDAAVTQSYTPVIWVTVGVTLVLTAIFLLMLLRIQRLQFSAEETMQRLAYFDDLTGIYNKNRFLLEMVDRLSDTQEAWALACLNINDFKTFNETFGFDEGNAVIQHAAQVFRTAAAHGELYSRYVSERFCLLLRYTSETILCGRLMEMMHRISDYTEHNNLSYHIVMNCGAHVILPKNAGTDPHLLLDHAMDALNLEKGRHFNNVTFYDEDAHQRALVRAEIEQEMRAALAENQFQVYLQPKYSANSQQIVGAEALIRWRHPKKGLIQPIAFIPIFEDNGFVTELDLYVLQKVCEQKRSWAERGLPDVLISVNQSRVLLYQSDYISRLHAILSATGVQPQQIELEITESVLFENQAAMAAIITHLHSAGFRTSMDDFGSGFSSLSILKDLPIDALKLDRTFFDVTADSERGRCIISNVLQMAKELSIDTVAEGIETKEQFDFLRDAGCDIIQGFYFSKPLSIPEFESLAFDRATPG